MIRHDFALAMFTLCITGLIFSQVYGQESYNIPQWVKNNVKLWADNSISDSGLESSMKYLMNIGISQVPLQAQTISETKIPAWVKNTAGWWADGKLSDSDFVNGIGYLIKTGIIQLKTASTQPVTNPPNATGSQNIPNIPVATTNTKPTVIPTKILLLVSNPNTISQDSFYSFQAKVFDASQVKSGQTDQNTFNQNWGTLSGIRVQGHLTSSDNKTTFYTWDGLTNQFGLFAGQYYMRNEPGNQVYFVHFNATSSGMINDSKSYQFFLLSYRS
jgi:hypothetical protein